MIFLDYPGGTYTPPDPSDIGGIDADTVLMLHCDGTDTSTSFPDASDSAHTVTANGDAQVDTAQSKFGGASGLFDGTGDSLSIATSSDFVFGSGAFCVDGWVYLNTTPGTTSRAIIGHFGTTSNWNGTNGIEWKIEIYSDAVLQFQWCQGGSSFGTLSYSTSVQGAWHHVCASGDGTTIRLYIDGVLEDSSAGTITGISSPSSLLIANDPVGDRSWLGWIDEMRVSKGQARIDDPADPLYCGGTPSNGFTPPAYAYTDKR